MLNPDEEEITVASNTAAENEPAKISDKENFMANAKSGSKIDLDIDPVTEETMESQIAAIRAEVAALASSLTALGKDKVSDLQAAAAGLTEEAGLRARAAYGDVRAEAERLEERLETHVQEKPIQSLLAAFGLGLIVSLILRR